MLSLCAFCVRIPMKTTCTVVHTDQLHVFSPMQNTSQHRVTKKTKQTNKKTTMCHLFMRLTRKNLLGLRIWISPIKCG